MVQPGECITFRNGLTVDKRYVPPPSIPWTPTPPSVPAYPTYPLYPGPVYSGSASHMTKMVDPYEAGRQARAESDG